MRAGPAWKVEAKAFEARDHRVDHFAETERPYVQSSAHRLVSGRFDGDVVETVKQRCAELPHCFDESFRIVAKAIHCNGSACRVCSERHKFYGSLSYAN